MGLKAGEMKLIRFIKCSELVGRCNKRLATAEAVIAKLESELDQINLEIEEADNDGLTIAADKLSESYLNKEAEITKARQDLATAHIMVGRAIRMQLRAEAELTAED